MPEILPIERLEELTPFANDQNLIEIVMRQRNKQFKTFQKVLINNLSKTNESELIKNAITSIQKNQDVIVKNLGFISKQNQLCLLVNGLNLCTTCAGFAILYEKLDKISAQLGQQITQVSNTIKQTNNAQADYEFNKVLGEYTDMLDKRRLQQPYSEEKLRELVDQEYNVLTLLISYFKKGLSKDQEPLVFSIFSLLSMFTVTLQYFDEAYYINNHQTLVESGDNVWHSSHKKWMSMYSSLLEQDFIEKLQDYTFFEKGFLTFDADIFYTELLDQVISQKKDIEENQYMITALAEVKALSQVREYIKRDIKNTLDKTYNDSLPMDNPRMNEAYINSLQQLAL